MHRVLCACAGFLLAVLWFDLMFDVQVLAHTGTGPLPTEVLDSIAGYYRRVTTEAGMAFLVGSVMLVTLGTGIAQLARGAGAPWLRTLRFALCAAPILLALAKIVPDARRLGQQADPPAVQSALARSICREHIGAFACVSGFLALQLFGPGARRRNDPRPGSVGV